jgi:hypothetical protein
MFSGSLGDQAAAAPFLYALILGDLAQKLFCSNSGLF